MGIVDAIRRLKGNRKFDNNGFLSSLMNTISGKSKVGKGLEVP